MPTWTRGDLGNELRQRGFHFLDRDSATRVNEIVHAAVEEIVSEAPWPWAYREQTLALPATIADLGSIEQVTYTGIRPVLPIPYQTLRDRYIELTTVGAPMYYYLKGEELGVYPTSTDSATVAYYTSYGWRDSGGNYTEEAENDAAEPIVPSRWRGAIVNLAVSLAQADSEDFDERDAVRAQYDADLERMRRTELRPINDELRTIRIASGEDWA